MTNMWGGFCWGEILSVANLAFKAMVDGFSWWPRKKKSQKEKKENFAGWWWVVFLCLSQMTPHQKSRRERRNSQRSKNISDFVISPVLYLLNLKYIFIQQSNHAHVMSMRLLATDWTDISIIQNFAIKIILYRFWILSYLPGRKKSTFKWENILVQFKPPSSCCSEFCLCHRPLLYDNIIQNSDDDKNCDADDDDDNRNRKASVMKRLRAPG